MFQGKDADVRDDIYSAACVIYELLAGKHPYRGLQDSSRGRAESCSRRLIPSLSRRQNDALRKGLCFRTRAERTSTISEFKQGLVRAPRAEIRQRRSLISYRLVAGLEFPGGARNSRSIPIDVRYPGIEAIHDRDGLAISAPVRAASASPISVANAGRRRPLFRRPSLW